MGEEGTQAELERSLFGVVWSEVAARLSVDSRLNRVREQIETSFDDPTFDLSAAATAARVEKNHLNRLLRGVTGMTFRRLLEAYRVRCAVTLLRQGEGTVVDAAFACGFGSLRSFQRACRRLLGAPPGRLRR